MYEVADYTDVNGRGTALLLEAMIERAKRQPFDRLVVASSMSIYGEGRYRRADGSTSDQAHRTRDQLSAHRWEPLDADGGPLAPVPTPETKAPTLSSIYALGKFDQERSVLLFGEAYEQPTAALRFFNVYGPDQALSNPYTGVLAIFASRLLNGRRPLLFEDGEQRRDFVSVRDVARACALALERSEATGQAINIGSGTGVTINEIAIRLARILGRPELEAEVTGRYRVGDIRHCFADVARAHELLGYAPEVELEAGVTELAGWLEHQIAEDRVEEARGELDLRGLTV
jgi:dTDP-L-rhamnose 4-epimerase